MLAWTVGLPIHANLCENASHISAARGEIKESGGRVQLLCF
uniref:Uncharacterized protein n=1 Tax=Anguilla anguilla TaxID=7936 RepID=A0A0E9TYR9_ANGAN